jgi:Flp pilus assembly protein TadG
MYNKKSEKGQAIIFIVFAIVGLVGLTALTVDGGMAYSDRRNAQNAADNSALAAARSKVRNNSGWKADAVTLANSNGFPDTDYTTVQTSPRSNIEVYTCNETGNTCPVPYAGDASYLQVIITSNVSTFFAPVVGVRTVTNRVYSIASADAGYKGNIVNFSAMAGLSDTGQCNSGTNPPGLSFGGSGNSNNVQVTIHNSGLYSNTPASCGIYFKGNANATADSFNSAGGVDSIGSSTYVGTEHENLGTLAEPVPSLPNPVCDTNATLKSGTTDTLLPGTVTGDFPPSGVTKLTSGFYCVDGDFKMTGGTLTGNGVTIVMKSGEIKLTGGTTNLSAPTSGPYPGLLMYAPKSNTSDMLINSTTNVTWQGTTLLPKMIVNLAGNMNWCNYSGGACTGPVKSQIIAWTIEVTGTAHVDIEYDPTVLWIPDIPPSVNLAK